MNWTAGSMNAGGRTIIAPGATNYIANGMTVFLSRTLENAGTILWTGGDSFKIQGNGGVVTNRPGALFEARNNANFSPSPSGNGRFDNAGIFRKASGTGTTTFDASGFFGTSFAFNNYGTLDIRSGIVAANGGYTSSSGALLDCALGGTTAGTGYGQLQVAGAVTLNGALSVSLTNGFVPGNNDSFTVLSAGSRSGTFATFSYPSNQATMQLSNTANSVIVRSTGPYFVTPPQLPDAARMLGYTQQVVAVAGPAPISFALTSGSLPAGLAISSGGLITGVPSVAATNTFALRITDTSGATNQQTFSLRVLQPVFAPTGMISWWRGEGNALDSVGTNHGVLTNGATFAAGQVGQTFALDGVNDYVQAPDSASLRPASVTVEAWVKFFATNGIRIVLVKVLGSGTFDSYGLALQDGAVIAAICDNSGFGPFLSGPANTALGQWYHLAFTFDDTSKLEALYINGALVASATANKTMSYDTHPLLIGADIENGVPSFFHNGQIDEATVYNRALSSNEIAGIYNAGVAGKHILTPYEQWKQTYLGDFYADDMADPDGDGFNNLAEYTADTNPTNANSNLRFTTVTPVPAGTALQWQGGTLATQWLQRSFGLGPAASWQDIFTNLPPTPNLSSFTNTSGLNDTRFYRIRVAR